jgi:hypothetical protein
MSSVMGCVGCEESRVAGVMRKVLSSAVGAVHVSDVLREDEGGGERCDGGGEVEQVAGIGGECCGGFGEDVRTLDLGDVGERGLRGKAGRGEAGSGGEGEASAGEGLGHGGSGCTGLDELRAMSL